MRKDFRFPARFWLESQGRSILAMGGDHFKVFMYLIAGPNAQISGIYPLSPAEVAERTRLDPDQVAKIIAELEEIGWCETGEGLIWIRGTGNINDQLGTRDFRTNPKWVAGTIKYLENLPASRLVERFCEYHGIGTGYPSDRESGSSLSPSPSLSPVSFSPSREEPQTPDGGGRRGQKSGHRTQTEGRP